MPRLLSFVSNRSFCAKPDGVVFVLVVSPHFGGAVTIESPRSPSSHVIAVSENLTTDEHGFNRSGIPEIAESERSSPTMNQECSAFQFGFLAIFLSRVNQLYLCLSAVLFSDSVRITAIPYSHLVIKFRSSSLKPAVRYKDCAGWFSRPTSRRSASMPAFLHRSSAKATTALPNFWRRNGSRR